MGWFKSKQALNSRTMTALVYETVRIRNAELEPILEKSGAIYDPVENQLIVMVINFEILRWELEKGNPKATVESVIDAGYQKFFDSLYVDDSKKLEYQNVMDSAKKKVDEILFSHLKQKVSKHIFVYKLILELEEIKEIIIEPSIRKEMELLVEGWFKVAETVNETYKIVDTPDDLEKNKPIDFDF